MEQKEVNQILQETEDGYNQMAQKFSETRKFFWRDLEFVKDFANRNVLDFGCGNGRLFDLVKNSNIEYYGVDVSENLINLAKEKYQDFPQAHFSKISSREISLPFSANFFNTIYSIATFHHLPSEYRKLMAEELYRITKSEGYVVVTVWDLWQKKYRGKIWKNWIGKLFFRSNLDWNDCYVTFKDNQGNVFKRYHHAFTERELKKLFDEVGFKSIECQSSSKGNLIYIGKK